MSNFPGSVQFSMNSKRPGWSGRLQLRPTGWRPVLCPGLQPKMGEDLFDHRLLKNRRDDLQQTGAVRAMLSGLPSQSWRLQAAESLRKISTRRFCERLLSLSLPATGSREPRPTTVMRSRDTPRTLR